MSPKKKLAVQPGTAKPGERNDPVRPGKRNLAAEEVSRRQAEEALQISETRYRRLFETAQDGILLLNAETGQVEDVNPFLVKMLGYSHEQLLGRKIWEIGPLKDIAASREAFRQLQEKEYIRYEDLPLETSDGRQIRVEFISNVYLVDHTRVIQCNIRDISERKQAEAELRRRTLELNALQQIVLDISSLHSLPELLNLVVERAASLLNASGGGLYLTEAGQRQMRCVVSYKTKVDFTGTLLEFGIGAAGVVAETGQPLIIDDYSQWERRAKVFDDAQPFQAVMSAPMLWQGQVRGVIHVLRDDRSNQFTREELNLLTRFANHAAVAVENARLLNLLNQELSEHRQVEEALRASEARFRTIFENSPVGIFQSTPQGRYIQMNPRLAAMYGYDSSAEAIASITDIGKQVYVDPARRQEFNRRLEEQGQISEFVNQNRCKDGRIIWTSTDVRVVKDRDGKIQYYEGFMTDVTERKRAEQKLQERVKELQAFFSLSALVEKGGVTLDEIYQELVEILCRSWQYPEITCARIVMGAREFRSKNYRGSAWALCAPVMGHGAKVGKIEVGYLEEKPMEAEGPFLKEERQLINAIAERLGHISERKLAEEEIRRINASLEQRVEERTRQLGAAQEKIIRQEKLSALGQMAGSVGHELRNPLSVINTAVYYLNLIQPDADEKVRQHLGIIKQEVQNANKIITDLLDFARIKGVERQNVSVELLVRETLERFPVPAGVELSLDLPAGLPVVFADPRQIQQVLGNLVSNACQAMLEPALGSSTGLADGGRLTIQADWFPERTRDDAPGSTRDDAPERTRDDAPERTRDDAVAQDAARNDNQQWVRIHVRDTGTGITPENMHKLFEPLFTTKTRGIGLGLAVSQKLAETNGGRIEVESEVGNGSTFTLVLPACGKE